MPSSWHLCRLRQLCNRWLFGLSGSNRQPRQTGLDCAAIVCFPCRMDETSRPPPTALAAIETLIARDPDFAAIQDRAGALPWRRRTPGFPGLLQAIVAQMISNQAAAAIW